MTGPAHIYLHIGLHKTGTSTLQEYLFSRRDRLLEQAGVYYPALQANLSRPLSSLFHDNPAAYSQNVLHGVDTAEKVAEQNSRLQRELDREFERCTVSRMLMSGEDVCLLSDEALSRLASWLQQRCDAFTVVCVLRDPTGWSTSAAQSRIRGGETLDEVNADHRVQRLKPLLETIAGAFGYERMRWLDFQRLVGHPDNYIAAFLEALDLPADWTKGDSVAIVNESMSMEAAQVVSAINAARPLYRDGRLSPERWPNDIGPICDAVPGQKFRLADATLERIRNDERPLLEWLREHFGFSFAPGAGHPPVRTPEPLTVSAASIEAMALAMHDLERFRLENQELRSALDASSTDSGA